MSAPGAVTADQQVGAAEEQLYMKIWPKLRVLLKRQPQGLTSDEMISGLSDPRVDNALMARFLSKMTRVHCILGMVKTHPPTFVERQKEVYEKLREVSEQEIRIYECVETTQRDGISTAEMGRLTNVNSRELQRVLRKLTKIELVHAFTHPRSKKKMYILTHLQAFADSRLNSFQNDKGAVNGDFVTEIYDLLLTALRKAGEKGLTAKELAKQTTREGGMTKQVPSMDVERILMLLILDGKAEIVPSSIPQNMFMELTDDVHSSPEHLLLRIRKVRAAKCDVLAEIATEQERRVKRKCGTLKRNRAAMEKDSGAKSESADPSAKRVKIEDYDVSESRNLLQTALEHRVKVDAEREERLKVEGEDQLRFRALRFEPENAFSQVPCISCPVSSQCREGAVVNPVDCEYMNSWLELF